MADDSDGYGGGFSGGNYSFGGTPAGGSGMTLGGGNVGLGNAPNSYGADTNYGMSTNYGLGGGTPANGLNVNPSTVGQLGELGSTNYGFGGLGTDYGFNSGGYNIGGNLGQSLGTLADISRYPTTPVNYGFTEQSPTGYSPAGNPNQSFTGYGQEGMRALANGPDYALSQGVGGLGITGSENGKPTSWWNHPAVSAFTKILGLVPATRPLASGIGIAQGLANGDASQAIGRINPLAGMGYSIGTSSDPTRTAANIGANVIGNQVAGPVGGALIGGLMNTAFGNARADQRAVGAFGSTSPMQAGITSAQNTPTSIQGGGGTDWGNLATLVGKGVGAYQALNGTSQLASNAANTNANLQSSMSGLSDMYNPSGAYAQQLKQELARRDAKAGRNSQYGPRSVELQAALAKMQAQAAQSMSGLAGASTTANAQAQTANNSQLQTLAQILSAAGDKNTRNQVASAWGDLKGLFSTPSSTPTVQSAGYQAPTSDNSLYSLWT